MVMIVIHHFIVHGLGLTSLADGDAASFANGERAVPIAYCLNVFCICAVNCFILISGYFRIKTTIKKYVYLLLTLLFYVLIFRTLPEAIAGNWKSAIISLFLLSHSSYWFVIDYLFLMVLTPMINLAYDAFTKRQRWLTTIGLVVISSYFGYVWGHGDNFDGYTLIQFITMYCIGRQIALSNISLSKRYSLATYCGACLLMGALGWGLIAQGKYQSAWKLTFYNDPLTIISAIGLFLVFKNITLSSPTINRLARSAFGIYLFQESGYISSILYNMIKDLAPAAGLSIYPLIIAIALATSGVAILFDQLRLLFVTTCQKRLNGGSGW